MTTTVARATAAFCTHCTKRSTCRRRVFTSSHPEGCARGGHQQSSASVFVAALKRSRRSRQKAFAQQKSFADTTSRQRMHVQVEPATRTVFTRGRTHDSAADGQATHGLSMLPGFMYMHVVRIGARPQLLQSCGCCNVQRPRAGCLPERALRRQLSIGPQDLGPADKFQRRTSQIMLGR